jgi:hypothetical protein
MEEIFKSLTQIWPGWCRQDGALCGEPGRLSAVEFEAAMRQQLRLYASRRLSDFLAHGNGGECDRAQVRAAYGGHHALRCGS